MGTYSGNELPASENWVERGAVTPIKNQGTCGSCWAFASIAALESAWFIHSGSLVSMSEQALLDCVGQGTGCQGGNAHKVYDYLKTNPAYTDESWPYPQPGVQQTCATPEAAVVAIPAGTVTGERRVPKDDAKALMEAVSKQPVVVILNADAQLWKSYKSGVMVEQCSSTLDGTGNHLVTIVGYGTEDGQDYWLVKNSWGTQFGIDGYYKIARNMNQTEGQCGIRHDPSYPGVDGSGPAPEQRRLLRGFIV